MQTWAQQHLPDAVSEGSRAYLLALFEEHVDAGLAWVRSHGSEYVPSVDIALVTSLTSLVQVHLPAQPHMSCLLAFCASGRKWHASALNRDPGIPWRRFLCGPPVCLWPQLKVAFLGRSWDAFTWQQLHSSQSRLCCHPCCYVRVPLSLLVTMHCSATCCHAQLRSGLR